MSQKLLDAVKMWRDRKEFYKREHAILLSQNEELQSQIREMQQRTVKPEASRQIAKLEEKHASYKQQVASLTQQKENLRDQESHIKEDNIRLAHKLLRAQQRFASEREKNEALAFQKWYLGVVCKNLEDYERVYAALLLKHARNLPRHVQDRLHQQKPRASFRGAVFAVIFILRTRDKMHESRQLEADVDSLGRFKTSFSRSSR
jgi:hypothetical protein